MKAALLLIYPAPILCRTIAALQAIREEPLTVYYQHPMQKIRPDYDWQTPESLHLTRLNTPGKYRELLQHDLILIHGIWTNALTYLVYAAACLRGKKVINLTEAENRYRRKSWQVLLKRLSVALLPKSKTYFLSLGGHPVCVEDYSKYGFGKDNFFPFAYSGALQEPKAVIHKSYRTGERVRLLFVGQLHHRKGVDILLECLAATGNKDYKLKICGRGPQEEELKALCRKLGIEERVCFAGHLDTQSLGKAYSEADLFVLPSRFEGYGAVLNEAAAHSLPLVSSEQVMAHHLLIQEGSNGYVFRNREHLTEILLTLFTKPQMLSTMRKASYLASRKLRPGELAHTMNQYIREVWDRN